MWLAPIACLFLRTAWAALYMMALCVPSTGNTVQLHPIIFCPSSSSGVYVGYLLGLTGIDLHVIHGFLLACVCR